MAYTPPPPGPDPVNLVQFDAARHLMTPAEYARLAAAAGARLLERGGVVWREVRPLFYRPLLSSQPLDERTMLAPCRWPGGFQHAVCEPASANSTMNFLVYAQNRDYDLQTLSHEHRRVIKNAAKRFQVRLVDSLPELVDRGHPAYMSFYHRTGYRYLTERKDWAASRPGRGG